MALGLPLAIVQEPEGATRFCKGCCSADVYKSRVFLGRDKFTPSGSHWA